MIITHKKVPSESNKVGLEDWTDEHNIQTENSYRVRELIEKKTLTAGTTNLTFENLDLFTDKVLFGDFDLDISNDGSERMLNLQFNSDTNASNYDNTQVHISYSYMGPQHNWNGNQVIMRGWTTGNNHLHGHFNVRGKNGIKKIFECFSGTPTSERFESVVNWNDTSNNVTSFKISISGGSFSGEISLYKWVDLLV